MKKLFFMITLLFSTLIFANTDAYKAEYNLKKGTYTLKFGHTHEHNMLLKFSENANQTQKVNQKETIKIDTTKVFDVQMAHFNGEINLNVEKDQKITLITSHAPGSDLPFDLYDANNKKVDFVSQVVIDNSKNDIYNGYFKDDMVKDRPSLEDWAGIWTSVYPMLKKGELDVVMEAKAKKANKTAKYYKDYYEIGYKTDVDRIDIDKNTMTFYRNGKAYKAEYEYKGYQILNYAKGNRGVRFLFSAKGDAKGAPKNVQFSDHNIYPTKVTHYHIYFGDKSHEELLKEMDNWPTYYPTNYTKADIINDMLGH